MKDRDNTRRARGNGLQHIACSLLHIQFEWSIPELISGTTLYGHPHTSGCTQSGTGFNTICYATIVGSPSFRIAIANPVALACLYVQGGGAEWNGDEVQEV